MWESDSRIRISVAPLSGGESHSRAKYDEETVVCVGGVVVARGASSGSERVEWCGARGAWHRASGASSKSRGDSVQGELLRHVGITLGDGEGWEPIGGVLRSILLPSIAVIVDGSRRSGGRLVLKLNTNGYCL